MMEKPPARLAHVALIAREPAALAAFYQDLFGWDIVGQAPNGANAFVGGHPAEENHDLAFFRGQNTAHIGLRVETLTDLLSYYRELQARNQKISFTFNHGFALALYFPDPEGNLIEVYWATGRDDYRPPYAELVDLGRSEDELRRMIAEMPPMRERG